MVSPTNRELRSALRQMEKQRTIRNLTKIKHLELPQLFRLRDAAKQIEAQGIELETLLSSKMVEIAIRMRG